MNPILNQSFVPFLLFVQYKLIGETDRKVEKCEKCEIFPHELVNAAAPPDYDKAYTRII